MTPPAERVLVVTPDTGLAASLRYALEALEPKLGVTHASSAEQAFVELARTDAPQPFLVLAHAAIEDQPAADFLAAAARRHPAVVRVLTADLPPVEARAAVLRACLNAGLFAFVPQPWLFQNLGHLLDVARLRHSGQPTQPVQTVPRQARHYLFNDPVAFGY